MDKEGNLYLSDDASEEDRDRAEEWADEIEKQYEKLKEFERQQEVKNK